MVAKGLVEDIAILKNSSMRKSQHSSTMKALKMPKRSELTFMSRISGTVGDS